MYLFTVWVAESLPEVKDATIKGIEDFIKKIESQIKKGRDNFFEDLEDYDSAVQRISAIGENIKKLPLELRNNYSEVNWKKIVRFRDIASHDYPSISKKIFSEIIEKDIPLLKKAIKQMRKVAYPQRANKEGLK